MNHPLPHVTWLIPVFTSEVLKTEEFRLRWEKANREEQLEALRILAASKVNSVETPLETGQFVFRVAISHNANLRFKALRHLFEPSTAFDNESPQSCYRFLIPDYAELADGTPLRGRAIHKASKINSVEVWSVNDSNILFRLIQLSKVLAYFAQKWTAARSTWTNFSAFRDNDLPSAVEMLGVFSLIRQVQSPPNEVDGYDRLIKRCVSVYQKHCACDTEKLDCLKKMERAVYEVLEQDPCIKMGCKCGVKLHCLMNQIYYDVGVIHPDKEKHAPGLRKAISTHGAPTIMCAMLFALFDVIELLTEIGEVLENDLNYWVEAQQIPPPNVLGVHEFFEDATW